MLKAELEARLAYEIERREAAEKAIVTLKRDVAVKAQDLADEHGWCSVVQEALHDLGIEAATPTFVAEVVVRMRVRGKPRDRSEVTESFVLDSIAHFVGDAYSVDEFEFDDDLDADATEIISSNIDVESVDIIKD